MPSMGRFILSRANAALGGPVIAVGIILIGRRSLAPRQDVRFEGRRRQGSGMEGKQDVSAPERTMDAAKRTALYRSPAFLEHETGAHVENASRLVAIETEFADLRSSAIWRLKTKMDDARAQGWDLLAEIVSEVKRQIARSTARLAALRRQRAARAKTVT